MSGPIRDQGDRRRERLEVLSPVQRNRISTPRPPCCDASPNLVASALHQVSDANSGAPDYSWPLVAMQVAEPAHSPSSAPPVPATIVPPTPPAVHPGPTNQVAIVNNSSNVNHNAPGGIIVNHNNNVTQVISRDKTAEDLNMIDKGLGQHHVSRAVHDAQPPTAGCIEGTRVQLLESTLKLLRFRGGTHIVWIAGMAGTGKTSIALTLSRRLSEEPAVQLGGTFFCSRSASMLDRTDVQRIIPTLAILLARQVPEYARALSVELTKDPDLASKAVTVQVERLLAKPLKCVRTRDKQILFVVDALDECADQAKLADLINALADFETVPLNNLGNRARLLNLIDALHDFKTTRLDKQAMLAQLIDALVSFKSAPLDKSDHRQKLINLIDALAELKTTPLDDQVKLAEFIDGLAALKTTSLDDSGNRARLVGLIESLAGFRATRLDDRTRLPELIVALLDFKTTPLADGSNQARLEGLIEALLDCETTRLKNLGDQAKLSKLIDALADLRSTPPVKFLLTSRPEMHIRDTLITDASLSSILQLHMVDEALVTRDIRLYIQRTLEKSSRSSVWYTNQDIDDLAALSAGLFIFASTVIAYILRRKDAPGRSERLRTVKQQTSASAIVTDPLDKMYSLILMQASDPTAYEQTELDRTRRIVAAILSTRSPLTIKTLSELLVLSPEHLRGALDELHAVIFVPEQDEKGELRTLHASFGDFIFTRAPEHIRIERNLGHCELAKACLLQMASGDLCFNVSRSRSSYEPNPETKPAWIARSLVYACLHWAHHIALSTSKPSFDDIFESVIRQKFLFWLELLSVMGEVDRASELLHLAASKVTSLGASRFLLDAESFVTSFREAIEHSAPHFYLSALAFAPKNSLVYQTFHLHFTGLPKIEMIGFDSWNGRTMPVSYPNGGSLYVLPADGHADKVNAVSITRDGRLIASASADGSVRVWDVQTRQQVYMPLLGHKGPVHSVAFSVDDRWIATGSQDKTVRLWNAQTGGPAMPTFYGHAGSITAVAFSPNGLDLASGSWDMSVRIWMVATGQLVGVQQIECINPVYSIAYSPGGELIAVGGAYGELQIFDAYNGEETQTCKRPEESPWPGGSYAIRGGFHFIASLDFSPDGTQIVAAFNDEHIVLDAHTGHCVIKRDAYSEGVHTVAYSPDGQLIASGTEDRTVRLRSPSTQERLKPVLRGHADEVSSVSFSSDGRFLVTGSWDKTVRLWDLKKSWLLAQDRIRSPTASLAFARYDGGWLVSPSGKFLLWVPANYRGYLEIGNHSRLIATHRIVVTALHDVMYQGEQWNLCWHTHDPAGFQAYSGSPLTCNE